MLISLKKFKNIKSISSVHKVLKKYLNKVNNKYDLLCSCNSNENPSDNSRRLLALKYFRTQTFNHKVKKKQLKIT